MCLECCHNSPLVTPDAKSVSTWVRRNHQLLTSVIAPGKSYRQSISLIELGDMFPDEETATKWFEAIYWQEKRCCVHCGGTRTSKAMPYWYNDCHNYFSVRTGTTLQSSRLPLRKWAFAVYLYVTHLKGVSYMKLHRDLKVTQKTAWLMLHRLRKAWGEAGLDKFTGPGEVDETYVRKQGTQQAFRQVTAC